MPANADNADDVTRILGELGRGDESAADRLLPLVYDRLRAIAGAYFKGQPVHHTLQPTALVHEAYLKLVDRPEAGFRDRAHFLAVCAVAMRRILVDHAREKAAQRRGGDWKRVTLSGIDSGAGETARSIDVLALDEALDRLARLSERQARVVECRFFAGMSVAEVAERLGVSARTVADDWRMARAWLHSQLRDSGGEEEAR
jgi:RNA polymerase sigma factor (TIGR02999 family)